MPNPLQRCSQCEDGRYWGENGRPRWWMIEIIAHRGIWKSQQEQNSIAAIHAALAAGFGVELDVRDLDGELVVAHDLPRAGAPRFDALYNEVSAIDVSRSWAVNVKADGLQDLLAPYAEKLGRRAFVFDASVPELRKYQQRGFRTFTRFSDIEPDPHLYALAAGIWVDCFARDTHPAEVFAPWLSEGKRLCFVSPELHGRQRSGLWVWLRDWSKHLADKRSVALCTDFPCEAKEYFR